MFSKRTHLILRTTCLTFGLVLFATGVARADSLAPLGQVTDACTAAALNGAATIAAMVNASEKAGYVFQALHPDSVTSDDQLSGANIIYLVIFASTEAPPHPPLQLRVREVCAEGGWNQVLSMNRQ